MCAAKCDLRRLNLPLFSVPEVAITPASLACTAGFTGGSMPITGIKYTYAEVTELEAVSAHGIVQKWTMQVILKAG